MPLCVWSVDMTANPVGLQAGVRHPVRLPAHHAAAAQALLRDRLVGVRAVEPGAGLHRHAQHGLPHRTGQSPTQPVSQGVQRDRGQLHAIRMRPATEVTHLFRPTPAFVLGPVVLPVVPVLTAWLAGAALLVVVQVFVMTAGYMLSDVMADALVVERQASKQASSTTPAAPLSAPPLLLTHRPQVVVS